MNTYLRCLLLFVCLWFVARPGSAQSLKTPYPILFVHGIVGDNTTWSEPGNFNDIIDYLIGAGLQSGGTIDISLDYYRDTNSFANTKEQDVHLFTNPVNADFYTVNFNVHGATGHPPVGGAVAKLKNESVVFPSSTHIFVYNPDQFEVLDIIRIQKEYLQVIGKNGDELTVKRGILNSIPDVYFFEPNIFNLSNESNQASIAKQGYGLKKAIDAIKLKTGSSKVILVGHSMGGLAAREYIRSYYKNDVAKIVTIGTPHYGSNLASLTGAPFTINGIDTKSDAYRDLKTGGDDLWHYILYGYLGVYLYGGAESSESIECYSKDVNGNGTQNDNVIGLNSFNPPFPEEVSRTWIASAWTGNPYINGQNDGVVLTRSQYIDSSDTLMVDRPHMSNLFGTSDKGESRDYFSLIRGLDEPANKILAYELDSNSITKGFITYQKGLNPNDSDLFKINISGRRKVTIKMLASSSTGINLIELLNSDLSVRKSTTDIYDNPMIDTLTADDYYIRVKGTASANSYQFPYTLTTNTALIPSGSLVVAPGNILEYYDVVKNEFRDKTITLTNTSTSAISVSNLSFTGLNADQFTISGPINFTIPPLGLTNVTVRFNPTDAGVKNAKLVITNSSTDSPVINISLLGIGVYSATRRLIITPDISYNFGNVNVSQNRSKTFLLKNTGSETFSVTGLSLKGINAESYSIISQPTTPFNIETGVVKQVIIKFLPASIGVKAADFIIANNSDNGTPNDSVTLYGNGTSSVYIGSSNHITSYEYWFDANYAGKVLLGTSTPQTILQLAAGIPTATLTRGLHILNIRFKDEKGQWSSVVSQHFYKFSSFPTSTNTITAYEYWFDNSYSKKVIRSTTAQSTLQLITDINTDSLTSGLHIFNARFKDSRGQYSSVISQHFYKLSAAPSATNTITAYEYWFDNKYAGKVFKGTTPQSTLQLITDINTESLTGGLHIFNARFKDNRGQWSSVISQHFLKSGTLSGGTNTITSYEYWFDSNYSDKVIQETSPQQTLQLITGINTESLTGGLHVFNSRFKDNRGQWSSVISQHFYKGGNMAGMPNFINGFRYWIDSDVASLTTVNLPVTTNPRYILEQINLANTDIGAHALNIQFRDLNNVWSIAVADTFYQIGKPSVNNIVPARGGNTGDVTVSINGSGFYQGTKVKLTRAGYPDIVVADSMMNIFRGQRINATFNLNNQATGFWNVIVTIPNDTLMILNNGFEIIKGIEADPYADINGFAAIRANQWQNYTIICGNRGNVNAIGVPLWIIIPRNVDIQLGFPTGHLQNTPAISFDTIPYSYDTDTILNEPGSFKAIPIFIPVITAYQTTTLNIKLRSPISQTFKISTWVGKPLYKNTDNLKSKTPSEISATSSSIFLSQDAVNCYLDVASIVIGQSPVYGCVYGWIDAGWRPVVNQAFYDEQVTFSLLTENFTQAALGCLPTKNSIGVSRDMFKFLTKAAEVSDNIGDANAAFGCAEAFLPQTGRPKRDLNINTVWSFDPNEKIGPNGEGAKKYIADKQPLSYTIHFENMNTASASAQSVRIIDTLNTSLFDLSTLQMGFVSIGDTILFPSPGSKSHSMMLDLRPKNDLVVQVAGALDEASGILSWTFTSLDPLTLLPTENPLAGFLPPNKIAPEGEGSVFYSIRLKDSIPNNSIIENKAYILFDFNPEIPTNNWSNTVDNIKPHSKVETLPAFQADSNFTVSWSGSDTSSGINSYSVYYSVNGGTFYPWKLNTQDKSAIFAGHVDSTYRFYSIAVDSAGNVETAPLIEDALILMMR